MSNVLRTVDLTFPFVKKSHAVACFLSNFSEDRIISQLLEFCLKDEFLYEVVEALFTAVDLEKNETAIVLVRVMLGFERSISVILPAKDEESDEILEVFPASWLKKRKIKKHIRDQRVKTVADRRGFGKGSEVYDGILVVTKRYGYLSFEVCVVLIEVLELILSIAPDLINKLLADIFDEVLSQYREVPCFENPPKKSEDEIVRKIRLLWRFARFIVNTRGDGDGSVPEEGS
jgi:hypothetical protein